MEPLEPTPTPDQTFTIRPRSLVRRVLHKTLHLSVPSKSLILLTVVVLGSLLCAADLIPKTELANPKNPVNTYLVKLCWGWTLLLVVPASFFPSVLYSGLQRRVIIQHLCRLLVSHVVWMVVTSLIVLLDSGVGTCSAEEVTDRTVCIRSGHIWTGFDISGHVFLLTYCIFVMTEESSNIKLEVWYEYLNVLALENHVVDKLTARAKRILPLMHGVASWIIEPLELLMLALLLVWTSMIVVTSVYFHTFLEKCLGFACAYVAWRLTYKCLYGKGSYLPCQPREGVLHPLRLFPAQSNSQS